MPIRATMLYQAPDCEHPGRCKARVGAMSVELHREACMRPFVEAIKRALEAIERFVEAIKQATLSKPIEFAGLIVAIATLLVLWVQIGGLVDSLESQAYNYIDSNQLNLDKIMIEHSELRSYFDDEKQPPPNDADLKRNTILAIADLKLDVIDGFYSQEKHIDWTSRYTREAWDQYYKDSFKRGQVLCWLICRDWNEYGKDIRQVASRPDACGAKIKQRDAKDFKKGCEWVP
jgi:hypothetical protein